MKQELRALEPNIRGELTCIETFAMEMLIYEMQLWPPLQQLSCSSVLLQACR